MTFHQIEYFLTIANSRTFLEAADTLNISQSSLSKQIIHLEKELDVKLFDRRGRTAVLNDAGKIFLKDAKQLYQQYQEIFQHLQPFTTTSKNILHLGTLPFLTQYNLTAKLKKFCEEHSEIQLVIHEVEDEQLLKGMAANDYDIIIARDELLHNLNYHTQTLANDRLVAILPLSHPLAGAANIDLLALAKENFILMHKYISTYSLCIRNCQNAGFTPRVIRTARVESILSAVAAKEGVSLICEKNLHIFTHKEISVVPLTTEIASSVVLAIDSLRKPSDPIQIFMDFML